MRTKHGVTGIIFDRVGGKRFFLVMHRVLNWSGWEFVKGGIDLGEAPEKAVLREVAEETGLGKITIVSALPQKVSWTARDTKYVYTPFILMGSMEEPVAIHQKITEHDSHAWVEEGKVESFLTHEDNKRIFREAIAILEEKSQ